MDFWNVIDSLLTFFQNNLLITIPFVCILLFLLYRKTKLFLMILSIVLLLAGLLYLISDVTTTGVTHKQKMIQEKDVP